MAGAPSVSATAARATVSSSVMAPSDSTTVRQAARKASFSVGLSARNASSAIINALFLKADVKDKRYKFF